MPPETSLRSVADTARWVAMYRALETERPDAHFRDPFARRLAGPRGERIYASLPRGMRGASWSVIARTVIIDRFLADAIREGATLVINLAAGLDSRPYRLRLPPALRWIEVDTPELLEEKATLLADATPQCRLERVGLDLSDPAKRLALLQNIPDPGERAVVLTEGLIMYLREADVIGLARDLLAVPAYERWITDLISPGLRAMINKEWGSALQAGNALMRFSPEAGPQFFEAQGWRAARCQPVLTEARRLRRLPWLLHLLGGFPGVDRYRANRPWSAVCDLRRLEG